MRRMRGIACRRATTQLQAIACNKNFVRKGIGMRAIPLLKRIALPLVVVAAVVTIQSSSLNAETNGVGFVYVMSNKSSSNSVIQYWRAADGSLKWVREVPTGGHGTGPNGADPLGSQDSLTMSGDGQFLIAVNAGSSEISVLGAKGGTLVWLSKTRSGGDFPNSVTISGDLVYALNSKGGTPNITGFRLDVNGILHWLATVPLPSGDSGANDVRFAPDGSELLVAVSGTNQILVFPVGANGVASAAVPQVAAGGSPFGIRFGHNEVALISEAAGSLSSYQLTGADMLNTISGAVVDTQKATCWISVPRDGKYAFVSNTGSGTLSSFAIDPNGTATLLAAVAANPGNTPIDSALSSDGKFLYADDSAQGKVLIFRVNGGSLTQIGTVPVSAGIQGIAAQ
jgi:6-phosphogluconolactonase